MGSVDKTLFTLKHVNASHMLVSSFQEMIENEF
jgi:hypothetical protein